MSGKVRTTWISDDIGTCPEKKVWNSVSGKYRTSLHLLTNRHQMPYLYTLWFWDIYSTVCMLFLMNANKHDSRHCENFWAFTGLRKGFGLTLLFYTQEFYWSCPCLISQCLRTGKFWGVRRFSHVSWYLTARFCMSLLSLEFNEHSRARASNHRVFYISSKDLWG